MNVKVVLLALALLGVMAVSARRMDCACPRILSPVCGVDGNTYPNECEADCVDVEVAHRGPCTPRPRPLF